MLILILLLLTAPVLAHWTDDASLEIRVRGNQAELTWQMAYPLVKAFDDDGDHLLSPEEVSKHQAGLQAMVRDKLVLDAGGHPAQLTFGADPAAARSDTHTGVLATARWEKPVDSLRVRYALWPPGADGPKCLLVVDQEGVSNSVVLTPVAEEYAGTPGGGFFFLGTEHIFTGYDHILFLIALLLPGGSLMSLIKTVTAFTLAHSLTLSLSVLGIISLPSQLVECVIAFSIIVAALLNFRREETHRRWPLALGFGLIHGLGFASILREHGVTGSDAALPLLSFNLGVEAGQVLIVLVAFPLLLWLHRQKFAFTAVRVLSALTALMALYWFVQRLTG